MLRFATTDSAPIEIQVTLTAPRVYLDHSVVSVLAGRNAELGRQFREELERTDGTLLLSWVHVIELFALGDGPTFKQIAAYLSTFGGRFAIIDADPSAVITRERQWTQSRQNPALDEDFIKLIGENWNGKSEMSLGILIDAIAKEPSFFEEIKRLHRDQKDNLKRQFDQQRDLYRSDPRTKQLLDSAHYPYSPPTFMTEKVGLELKRECVRTNRTSISCCRTVWTFFTPWLASRTVPTWYSTKNGHDGAIVSSFQKPQLLFLMGRK